MATTGLSQTATEYRQRLAKQADPQLDAWLAELMRDVARRRGVIKVVADVRKVFRLDEAGFSRAFARGGGAPATMGKDAEGHLIVPAVSLHFLVPGIHAVVPEARQRIIDFLVSGFDEIVYV